MPCFTPLKAYRAPDGGVVFDSKRGYSDRPLELGCGQCQGCRFERSRQWALRCVHEAQLHKRNSFVTLTYSPENVPRDGGLDVTHWQKFAKRLRKAIGPFRFFHCGEYGERNKRPHYHACLFGVDFSADRIEWKPSKYGSLYVSPLLAEVWGLGHCSVGALTYESAAYVARYCMKKLTGDMGEREYTRFDSETGEAWNVRPPYVTMSRGGRGGKGGIGSEWFEKFHSDVFPSDEVVHDGRRFTPPRYYLSKLEAQRGSDVVKAIQDARRARASKHKEDLTAARLAVREKVAAGRLTMLRRDV